MCAVVVHHGLVHCCLAGHGPVGLVSFPGSGNTWVRGLLQKATGVCTGKPGLAGGCGVRSAMNSKSDTMYVPVCI